MKLFCYLLAAYFLTLAGVTCADAKLRESPGKRVSLVENSVDSHAHTTENGMDSCSPLCVCHCCHIHVVAVREVSGILPLLLPVSYLQLDQNMTSADISGFFRPPIS